MSIQNLQNTNQSMGDLKQNSYMQAVQKEHVNKEAITTDSVQQKVKMNPEYIPDIAEKALIHAIEEANKKIAGPNTTFEISVHEKTKEIMVKVLNSDTKELIREIPSEKILDMVASMCEAAGIFIDEKR